LFSSDRERARKWLTIIVKTGNSEYVAEAQKLLSQIEDREK
jgi:FimV-like protein